MNRLLQIILGIDRPNGAEQTAAARLDVLALRQGTTAAAIIVGAFAFFFLTWWLYRHEGPALPRWKRALLSGLRVLTILALGAMLIEPVLVSSQRETLKSHLAIIL